MVIRMELVLILDNLRSTYNVGAILRTAEAVGVSRVIAVGTTPYPELDDDTRPPHVRTSNTREIAKAALGAERNVPIAYQADIKETLSGIKAANFTLLALEQAKNSIDVFTYERPDGSIALIVGPEVSGITPAVLELCDGILEIPMYGRKESLNVSVAAGIALYQLRR
jgi:23S rRNA (guanosine2251-2'-O)-methyltransferase